MLACGAASSSEMPAQFCKASNVGCKLSSIAFPACGLGSNGLWEGSLAWVTSVSPPFQPWQRGDAPLLIARSHFLISPCEFSVCASSARVQTQALAGGRPVAGLGRRLFLPPRFPSGGELPQYQEAVNMAAETYGINLPVNPMLLDFFWSGKLPRPRMPPVTCETEVHPLERHTGNQPRLVLEPRHFNDALLATDNSERSKHFHVCPSCGRCCHNSMGLLAACCWCSVGLDRASRENILCPHTKRTWKAL